MSRRVVLVLSEEQRAHLVQALGAMAEEMERAQENITEGTQLHQYGLMKLHQTCILRTGIANAKPETLSMSAMLPLTVK